MHIKKAQELLQFDIAKMNVEQLRKHYVDVVDAWRQSRAEYGYIEAVRNGFYFCAVSAGFSDKEFIPVDIWLTRNLENRLTEIEKRLKQ